MVIIRRSFTLRERVKVSRVDFELAMKGRKTCTIRLGQISVHNSAVLLTDGTRSMRVQIAKVDNSKVFRGLTAEDAKCEGLAGVNELHADLRRYYGNIDPDQPVTVIHFVRVG